MVKLHQIGIVDFSAGKFVFMLRFAAVGNMYDGHENREKASYFVVDRKSEM